MISSQQPGGMAATIRSRVLAALYAGMTMMVFPAARRPERIAEEAIHLGVRGVGVGRNTRRSHEGSGRSRSSLARTNVIREGKLSASHRAFGGRADCPDRDGSVARRSAELPPGRDAPRAGLPGSEEAPRSAARRAALASDQTRIALARWICYTRTPGRSRPRRRWAG